MSVEAMERNGKLESHQVAVVAGTEAVIRQHPGCTYRHSEPQRCYSNHHRPGSGT